METFRNNRGQLHRDDGPAVEYPNGTKEWWLNGEQLSEEEFNEHFIKQRAKKILKILK